MRAAIYYYFTNEQRLNKEQQRVSFLTKPFLMLCLFIASLGSHKALAQLKVGDNPTTINASSLLELESADKGVLLPRLELTSTNSASPLGAHVAGMVIYNTATAGSGATAVTPGFYYNNGSQWVNVSAASGTEWNLATGGDAYSDKTSQIKRTGSVVIGTGEATGQYSLAVGNNTTASGGYSFAAGNGSYAGGGAQNAVAIGLQDSAIALSNHGAIAIGYSAKAMATSAPVAIGYNPTATGISSTAIGRGTTASGNYSTAMGHGTTASGQYSTAMGSGTTASGTYSVAIGNNTTANGSSSVALGGSNTVADNNGMILGTMCYTSGRVACAIGNSDTVINNCGTGAWAMGYKCKVTGNTGVALGYRTTATGAVGTAMGQYTTASGTNSTAMGIGTTASGNYSTAMGISTTASGSYSTAMGNSTTASGSNSTAMGNATTASGGSSVAIGDNVTAKGPRTTAMGYQSFADGYYSFAMGYLDSAKHARSWAIGVGAKSSANYQFNAGFTGGYRLFTNGAQTTGVQLAANGTAWSSISDRRAKNSITGLHYGLNEVLKIKPSRYYYNGSDKLSLGFIAQEMKEVIPEIVETPENPDEMMSIRYTELIPVLAKAIQEQQELIEALKAENNALAEVNASTDVRLKAIESALHAGGLSVKSARK